MKMPKMVLVCGTLAVLTACGGEAEQSGDAPASADPATTMEDMPGMGGMPGIEEMPGMEGMSGATMDPAMAAGMRLHLERMAGLQPDSMLEMRPEHRRMVANILARVNQEMRDMGIPADSAWIATLDSIRGDLTRMPEMSGAEMQALMPGHRRRVGRLIESHEQMMAQMGH